MTRHIFKLVWNRKRSTGLILTEILLCFLVLCAILVSANKVYRQWSNSPGFDFHDVWAMQILGLNDEADGESLQRYLQAQAELLRMVKSMPQVDSAAYSSNTPFGDRTSLSMTYIEGQPKYILWNLVSSEISQVLKLKLLSGRWHNESDGTLDYKPILISGSLAEDLFGFDDPVGKEMPAFDKNGQLTTPDEDAKKRRIVGVMEDYSRQGFRKETDYQMMVPIDFNGNTFSGELLIRVQPGTTAEFEEQFLKVMKQVGPDWLYQGKLLEERRYDQLLGVALPLVILGVIAVFLIVMVGLGLVGVLWQSVTRRTGELGLRRALGASANSVRMQILKELWALTVLAVAAGTIIFLQFPLFGANLGASWPVILTGMAQAYVVIFVFVTFCGLYPTWLAMRIEPAEALNYE